AWRGDERAETAAGRRAMKIPPGNHLRPSALCCGIALSVLASPGARAAQDSFPKTPPPDLPARAFKLPNIQSKTLPNELKVVVAESHRVPLVTLRLAMRAGSVLDPSDQPGLASAVANQITAGTEKYSSLQLREAAERLGGTVGVSAAEDFTTVSASAL